MEEHFTAQLNAKDDLFNKLQSKMTSEKQDL
jgi:hypothetical protein